MEKLLPLKFASRLAVTLPSSLLRSGDAASGWCWSATTGERIYVRNKQRACEKANIRSTLHRLPAETTQADLLELIATLNADGDVHGILVQLPLPSQIDEQTVLDAVTPLKDVDCFHAENVGLMVQGRPQFLPCTPHRFSSS